ncbi:MAG TPA: tetratricopeptide repeat protein, partial [Blastocatellia bacterium]|nr:tetratricopeptide repeat protein [Blastocatellia bacterium]
FNRALGKLSFAEQPSAPSEARRALAEAYLARARGTDNDKALSILQDLAKSGKDSAQVLNDTGVALFENHQYAEAIDAFNRALYKQPGLLEALFNRALTEETSGKTAAAAKDWGEFVATSPEKDWKQEASSHLHRIESLPLQ